ncbi:MAG: hypothetical protein JO327_00470 [Nitrososphaeraceae archaeon]|nr:hypothetical protein [Nitrososphaeraceae archaeon]MBV9666580.1 hypothetical protein [Nitrososphaeraceae archaeon]
MIVLQLKSNHNTNYLEDISFIINYLYNKHNYKIRGHEIQQINSIIEKTTIAERTNIVSSFCSKHELDYLTYHTPFLVNDTNLYYDNIKWHQRIADSLLVTIKEAEKVYSDANLKHRIIIVFHINGFIPKQDLPFLTKETKNKIIKRLESSFIDCLYNNPTFRSDQDTNDQRYYLLAVENNYPKQSANSQLVGLYHPIDLLELKKYNVKVTLDLSHYQIYSNYLLYGNGNNTLGDLERQIYGANIPSWKDCIYMLRDSLAQLHISDAKGTDQNGEGLPLKEGEMDVEGILNEINSLEENRKIIQGTIELKEGHLNNAKLQKQSADWLLTNIRYGFG